jgi:hypothetical protein
MVTSSRKSLSAYAKRVLFAKGPSQGMARCEAITTIGHDKLQCMGGAGDFEQNNLITPGSAA